jgi:hypothetical protein
VSDLEERIHTLVEAGIRPLSLEEIPRRTTRGRIYPKPSRPLVLVVASAAVLGAVLVLAVALTGPVRHVSSQSTAATTSIRLAGYSARLPAGDLVSTPSTHNCHAVYPMSNSAFPLPMEGNATYAITTPTMAMACIGSLLTASYGQDRSSRSTTPDPVSPSNATPIKLGAFHAAIGDVDEFVYECDYATESGPPCSGNGSNQKSLGIWVQIPSTGGGYHDLIVGSWGLSKAKLIALVQSALPKHVAAAAAGQPPWTVIPACAAGQTPDPNSTSNQACA